MTLSRSLIAAALALGSSAASAVPYALPSGGYYQLQRTDTYKTVCQSDSRCDVPTGTYTLLDFIVSPAKRSRVTVGKGGGGSTPPAGSGPRVVYNSETVFGKGTVQVNCRRGEPTGGSCSFYGPDGTSYGAYGYSRGAEPQPILSFVSDGSTLTCSTLAPADRTQDTALSTLDITVVAACR